MVGPGDGGAEDGGGGGGGVGSAVDWAGLGAPFVGPGGPGCPFPPFPGGRADGSASVPSEADGEAVPDADSPGFAGASPFAFRPVWTPAPPPLTADPPSGASPPRCPAECEGAGRLPSSPTLMQPAAAATAMTVAARRTGTYKARTGSHLRMGRPLLWGYLPGP